MHASRRGSLNQPPHKEDRFRTTHGKGDGGSGQGDQAPEVGASTGIAMVREPTGDRLTASTVEPSEGGPMHGAMEKLTGSDKKTGSIGGE